MVKSLSVRVIERITCLSKLDASRQILGQLMTYEKVWSEDSFLPFLLDSWAASRCHWTRHCEISDHRDLSDWYVQVQ